MMVVRREWLVSHFYGGKITITLIIYLNVNGTLSKMFVCYVSAKYKYSIILVHNDKVQTFGHFYSNCA